MALTFRIPNASFTPKPERLGLETMPPRKRVAFAKAMLRRRYNHKKARPFYFITLEWKKLTYTSILKTNF